MLPSVEKCNGVWGGPKYKAPQLLAYPIILPNFFCLSFFLFNSLIRFCHVAVVMLEHLFIYFFYFIKSLFTFQWLIIKVWHCIVFYCLTFGRVSITGFTSCILFTLLILSIYKLYICVSVCMSILLIGFYVVECTSKFHKIIIKQLAKRFSPLLSVISGLTPSLAIFPPMSVNCNFLQFISIPELVDSVLTLFMRKETSSSDSTFY